MGQTKTHFLSAVLFLSLTTMMVGTLLSAISIYTNTSVGHIIKPPRRAPDNTLTQNHVRRGSKNDNRGNDDLLLFDLQTNPEHRIYDTLPNNWYKGNVKHTWI